MKHLLPLMTLTLSAQLACTGPVTQNGAVKTSNKKPAVSKAGISDGEEVATNKNSDSTATEESEESEDGHAHDHSHSAATDESTNIGANVTATNQTAPVSTSTTPTSTVQNSNIVEFHIKAGTGNGPWNDEASRINVKVGQELQIINDDDRTHLMHTNGAPFFHPFIPIAAGGKAVYKIASPLPNGTLYDHQTHGKIYINAER